MKRILIVAFLIAGLGGGIVYPSVLEKRRDVGVRALLLELQRAVQDYHVAEELYPELTPQSGNQLIGLLIESGHLTSPPQNPWTRAEWQLPDEARDYLIYKTDEFAETYTLVAYRSAAHDVVHHTLDSTENQSLEAAE